MANDKMHPVITPKYYQATKIVSILNFVRVGNFGFKSQKKKLKKGSTLKSNIACPSNDHYILLR